MKMIFLDRSIMRTIYYRILDKLVEYGHNVDERTYEDTEEGINQYYQDVAELERAKAYVKLVNESSRRNRGRVIAPSINLHLTQVLQGDIAGPFQLIEVEDNNFVRSGQTGTASNLTIEVYLTSMSSDQTYLLNNILFSAIPKRGYLQLYDGNPDDPQYFFIEHAVMEKLEEEDENTKDMRIVLRVTDVYVQDRVVQRDDVVPIKKISADIGTGLTHLTVEKPNP